MRQVRHNASRIRALVEFLAAATSSENQHAMLPAHTTLCLCVCENPVSKDFEW